jgi:hypothetical protein
VPGNEIGQYSRDGRWTGEHKTECGLHLIGPRRSAAGGARGPEPY